MAGIGLALPFRSIVSEAIDQRVSRKGGWRALAGALLNALATAGLVSLAATLATWPLIAANFQIIPWLGIPVSMLALPALPLALAGAFATALAGMAHPALGEFLGWIAWMPWSYLLGLVSWAPDWTSSGSWVGAPFALAWYGILGSLLLLPGGLSKVSRWLGRRTLPPPEEHHLADGHYGEYTFSVRKRVGLALAGFALAAGLLLWLQYFDGGDGNLHVHFFDVGQGDSALIVTPAGRQVLVDGGAGSRDAVLRLSKAMSIADRSIDLVVLTHLDADHSRGLLEVLDRYSVGLALKGADFTGAPMFAQWAAALHRSGVKEMPVESGYRIELEPEVILEVLNPPAAGSRFPANDVNNNAIVLRLVYRDVRMLLAGDIEAEAELHLARSGARLSSQVLKVPHHGSRTSSSKAFLEAVNPSLAVISRRRGKTGTAIRPVP